MIRSEYAKLSTREMTFGKVTSLIEAFSELSFIRHPLLELSLTEKFYQKAHKKRNLDIAQVLCIKASKSKVNPRLGHKARVIAVSLMRPFSTHQVCAELRCCFFLRDICLMRKVHKVSTQVQRGVEEIADPLPMKYVRKKIMVLSCYGNMVTRVFRCLLAESHLHGSIVIMK